MKILLDLQGAQSESRYRGIGRYSLSMAKAFAKEAAHHELWLMLNGRHDETSIDLIEQFGKFVPRKRVVINELPANIAGCHSMNGVRAQIAGAAQATLYSSVNADFIWHSSLFEGWGDDSIVTLGSGANDHRHIATFYDLIPLLHSERYLHDAGYRDWYYRRLALLKRCGLLLAISESSRREAINSLCIDAGNISVVYGAADPIFTASQADDGSWARWKKQWNLRPGFVLYAGGYDAHKNVDTLVAAFADLPTSLRQRHPLVLAGRCGDAEKKRLSLLARQHRIARESLIFTGTLEDSDLVKLYSSCTVFVAPSLHEGLGLPLLEAMACGAAVIGSNTASLPEVIGRADALFDPRSQSSMSAKLHEVLVDAGFAEKLRAHAQVQSRQFTWPTSARKALAAVEHHSERTHAFKAQSRPRLIYVSPLPSERTGIADYSARLLRELANHYAIDVVVDQPEVRDPWLQANFPIRSLRWFVSHAQSCERILYHFGNSPFHAHMFGMLEQHPGVVVLHDSWLGAVRNWMGDQAADSQSFLRTLYECHGYAALLHDLRHGRSSTLDAYPVNRDVIEQALGVIVHSNYAMQQVDRYYGNAAADKLVMVPFPKGRTRVDRRQARKLLGIEPNDFVVCSFGMLAPTKLNHRLLEAWFTSSLTKDKRCRLFFVGENHGGDYGRALASAIQASGSGCIHITGHVGMDRYLDYLGAADAAVQLRTDSRGETSAAIFDVLAQGLPLIVNANGSAAELPAAVVVTIRDAFDDVELISALEALRNDDASRVELATASAHWIENSHGPATVALKYRDAIERFVVESTAAEQRRLINDLKHVSEVFASDSTVPRQMQKSLSANRPRVDRPRLYIDVTNTSASFLHTGIERVVRGVLSSLLHIEQSLYRIEPVRIESGRFLHANRFGLQVLDYPEVALPEDEVAPRAGDIFVGLDWVADLLPANTDLLDAWRVRGVRMFFVVYDLLPVRMPANFPDGMAEMHARWLDCIGRYADGLIGISQSVLDDLRRWFDEHPPMRKYDLPLGYFYPGNDPASTRPSQGMPADALATLRQMRTSPSFLMVGTIEPRKGHALVLEAFEQLWAAGLAASLVIVGRQGWMSEALAKRLRSHIQTGRQLFWLEQVSDEYLELIYGAARALIAASEGEGFGLPLVEAARRGVTVIARDIPVFREVSSSFASYFDGDSIDSLVDAIRRTVASSAPAKSPDADVVLSWRDTTRAVWDMLSNPSHLQWLTPWRHS